MLLLNLFSKFTGNKITGSGRAQEFIGKLKTDLNLSADQLTKVEAAMREFFMEKKEMKQAGNKEGLRESKQDFKQDILAALNDDQKQKFMSNIEAYKKILKQ